MVESRAGVSSGGGGGIATSNLSYECAVILGVTIFPIFPLPNFAEGGGGGSIFAESVGGGSILLRLAGRSKCAWVKEEVEEEGEEEGEGGSLRFWAVVRVWVWVVVGMGVVRLGGWGRDGLIGDDWSSAGVGPGLDLLGDGVGGSLSPSSPSPTSPTSPPTSEGAGEEVVRVWVLALAL